MKKLFSIFSFSILTCSIASSQSIVDVLGYYTSKDPTKLTLLSDNSIWKYDEKNEQWQNEVKKNPLSDDIKFFDLYISGVSGAGKVSMMGYNTNLKINMNFVTVLKNNEMYQRNDDNKWILFSLDSLPENRSIKFFKTNSQMYQTENSTSRKDSQVPMYLFVLDDNSIWSYGISIEGKGLKTKMNPVWHKLSDKGLPDKYNVKYLTIYQENDKVGITNTKYAIVLADNTVWLRGLETDWESMVIPEVPSNTTITQLESFNSSGEVGGSNQLVIFSDGSMWWERLKSGAWEKWSSEGLPQGYQFKTVKVFEGGNNAANIIALLTDGTLWVCGAGYKEWTPIPLTGLPGK